MKNNDFNKLITGIEQVIDHNNGIRKLRTTTRRKYQFTPLKEYNADSIRSIRTSNHLSQNDLADLLGVKKKTVQAWEASRNIPNGAASRFLSVLEDDPRIIRRFLQSE